MKRAVSSRGGHVCDARCREGGVTGVIDDACRGGDECAHVGGDAYRGSFCEWNRCALLLWRRQMWLLPASAPVMAYIYRIHMQAHVGEPYAVVSILCEPIL